MKKVYVVPHMNIERATSEYVLAASASFEYVLAASASFEESKNPFDVARQNGWPIQLCPFNNKRCCDKQQGFNEWCAVVEDFAKHHVNHTFLTAPGMFDRCPHGYSALCAQHEQKQRG